MISLCLSELDHSDGVLSWLGRGCWLLSALSSKPGLILLPGHAVRGSVGSATLDWGSGCILCPGFSRSGQRFLDQTASLARQALLQTMVEVGQVLMIKAHQMKNGRVEIGDVIGIFDGLEA